MKVLIAADFFTEFELYETSKPNGLKNWVALSLLSAAPIYLDPTKYRLIGNHENMTTEEATKRADKIFYTSEIEKSIVE